MLDLANVEGTSNEDTNLMEVIDIFPKQKINKDNFSQ